MKPPKTGHIYIDHHHEEVFALDKLIEESISTGKRDPLLKIVSFLIDYCNDHFKMEEKLMKTHRPELLSGHEAEHKTLKENIFHLQQVSEKKASYTHLIFQIRKIIDQLIHHIQNTDIKLQELPHDHH